MDEVPRRKVWLFPVVLTEHVFDKVRLLDIGLAELEALLVDEGEVIEEVPVEDSASKEIVLLVPWRRPLHVVVIVDTAHQEERLITVYEPHADRWSDDFRRRR